MPASTTSNDTLQKAAAFEAKLANAEVAGKIYDSRTKAGLTESHFAKLAWTNPPVISRLEDANCDVHSLAILKRIASVLEKRVEIHFDSL